MARYRTNFKLAILFSAMAEVGSGSWHCAFKHRFHVGTDQVQDCCISDVVCTLWVIVDGFLPTGHSDLVQYTIERAADPLLPPLLTGCSTCTVGFFLREMKYVQGKH